MDFQKRKLLIGFYENELVNNVLSFWLGCEDKENGGYFNCFTNDGATLVSTDKYTWSQGRFVWLFSKLSRMDRPFTAAQRQRFLELAKSGRDFLVKHSFMEGDPLRCVFLMDAAGNPKYVDGYNQLDMSIYADGFVLAGLTQYAIAANDKASYDLAKVLFQSVMQRYESFSYRTLPYPISPEYVMHGFYMSRILHSYHMLESAQVFDPEYAVQVRAKLKESVDLLFTMFVDEQDILREVVYRDGGRVAGIFGNHSNPGHILEEMWFVQHAADLLGDDSYTERVVRITKKALEIGWDETYGGLVHFCDVNGGEPLPGDNDPVDEVVYQQLMTGWADKLWWVHSEALYVTLLLGQRTNDAELMAWYDKVFAYSYRVFPNPDTEIREWVQIQTREGKPQTKVTALPVKDPFHLARNLLYILLLLYRLDENA